VIDSPPGIWQLQDAAAAVAGFVLVPTKVDDASVDGLAEVADELTMIRKRYNPDVTVLGVVLTLVGSRHVRVIRRARERLAGLLGDSGVKVYEPVIRESVIAGIEGTRNMGRLAHEYKAVAANAAPWWKRPVKGSRPMSTRSCHRPEGSCRTLAIARGRYAMPARRWHALWHAGEQGRPRPRVLSDDELGDILGTRPAGLRGPLERSRYLERQSRDRG
jgi:hypothetical protein